MTSNDKLNIAVAQELGWKRCDTATNCWISPDYCHCNEDNGRRMPDFVGDLNEAIGLLDGRHWTLWTCDAGYTCCIHGKKAAEGVGATPAEAICRAFLQIKKGKG